MSNWFRRFWAFILTAVLLLTALPAAAGAQGTDGGDGDEPRTFTQADNQLLEDDVFARIDAVTAPSAGGPRKAPKRAPQTEADFAALVPQVIEAVEASDTYVEGTLQNNGGVLMWETTVGMPCTYNPRMEAKLHGAGEEPTEEERAALENLAAELKEKSASVKKAPALRGSGAGSMKIGLIQPFWESDSEYADRAFRSFSPYYVRTWQELCAAAGGEGLRYTMSNATVDNIAYAIEECGIVIFDSHGNIDTFSTSSANTSYLCLTTTEGITTADADVQTDPNGYMYFNCLKGDGYAEVNGACIANHMKKNAPNSLLYMGICYGMATDRLCAPLREKGVECCWGYSQPVSFAGDVLYMMTIMNRVGLGEYFCLAAEYAKQTYGYWDCASSYATAEEARQHDAAFPICVSSDDPYPGKWNVNAVQKVRSAWTLFPRDLPVIAVPDDLNHGTVQVAPDSSYTYLITASPEAGWYPAECVVESGNAAVTRESDFTFLVDISSSVSETCTVTVRFRELKKYDVTFVADGVVLNTVTCSETDRIDCPVPPAPEGWTFCGWSETQFPETIGDLQPAASILRPGEQYSASRDTALYAVYTRRTGCPEGSWERVETAPVDRNGNVDWTGEYVITATLLSEKCYMLKALPAGEEYIFNENGCMRIPEENMTADGKVLLNVPASGEYQFRFDRRGNGYSIRSVTENTYICTNATDVGGGSIMNQPIAVDEYVHAPAQGQSCLFEISEAAEVEGCTDIIAPFGDFRYLNFNGGGFGFLTYSGITALWTKAPFGYTYYTTGTQVSGWNILQQRINNAANGATLYWEESLTASETDGPLVIPAGKRLTLHLLDCELDRGLTAPRADGSVLTVLGDLTLSGNGVIRGGNTTGMGGGVLVGGSGRFTLEGGEITDNRAQYGGGAAVTDNALCLLREGSVTQNTAAADGGGIFADGGHVALTETGGEPVFANVPNDIAPENDPSVFAYEILYEADHTGCRVTADPPFAAAGERVALTPVPGNAFWFESMTASDADGANVPLTAEIDGTFTFTMPSSAMTAHAAFTPIPPVPTAADGIVNYFIYKPSSLFVYRGIPHGTVTAKAVIGGAEVPVSVYGDGVGESIQINGRKSFRLTVEPDPGYRLKRVIVESVTPHGFPDGKYHIPINPDFVFTMDKYREGMLFFRVNAEFEKGPEIYTVDITKPDPSAAGNTVTADKTYVVPGDTVTVTVGIAPGYQIGERRVYYKDASGNWPELAITQTAPDDPRTFTFTVPGDLAQERKKITVSVGFRETDHLTVDLGEGHEALAEAYVGKDGYTVSGSRVTMPFSGTTFADAETAALNDLMQNIRGLGLLPFEQNGEQFTGDLGLRPMADYADRAAFLAERGGWNEAPLPWDAVLYLQWLKPLQPGDVPVAVAPPVKGDAAAPAVTVTGKGVLNGAPEGWYESFGGTMNSFGPLAESITVGQTYYAAATVSPAYGYYVGSLEAIAVTGADVAFIGTSGNDVRCVFAAAGTFIPVSLTVYRTSVDGTDTAPSLVLTGLEKGILLSDVLVQNGVSPDVQFAQAGYKTMDCLTPKPFGEYGSPEELSADSVSPFFRLEEDTVLYCPMIKLLDAVELTVMPPVCGAATGTLHPEEPWTDQTDPPAVAVPEGAHYAPNAKNGGNAAWWSDPDTNKGYTGTFTGGQSYPLGLSLSADFGCEFSVDADAVTVHGGELLGNTVDNTGHLLEAAVSVTAAHSFGDWAVTTAPTCVDEGEESRVCAGCPETETRPVAATGIHTYGETGDARFTCTVCQQVDAERKASAEAADRAAADRAAADAVIEKIAAIGEVAYTDESKAKIDAAQEAYAALTDAQKALVTNAQTLTDAIVRYAELKTQAETPTDPTDPTNPTDPADPTDPTDPDTPSDGHTCPWDGVDHGTSIWGRLVRFFHSIFYFFARLFGRR